MAKNCVITLPDEIVEKASKAAKKRGKSLKDVIEDTITKEAAGADIDGTYIVEKEVEKEPWGVSRVALFSMRKAGRLIEGVHYKKKGRFVYYNVKRLRDYLAKAPAVSVPA